jgi:hypothetical protein
VKEQLQLVSVIDNLEKERNKPFEFSVISRLAGVFPDETRDVPGRALSALSIVEGCDILLPLGAALDWLSAGDFVWAAEGASDKLVVAGIVVLGAAAG